VIPMRMRQILRFLLIIPPLVTAVLATSGCRDASKSSGPHTKIELITDQDSISPGSTFSLGVKFTLEPGWHIYWKNPGDSGLPPRFTWKTPAQVSVDGPLWPYPERITTGPLTNYGYGSVLIPFQAKLSSQGTPSAVTVQVALEWLVCKDECLPGESSVELSLPVTAMSGAPSPYAKEFEAAFSRVPTPLQRVSIAIEEQQDKIILALIPLEQRQFPSAVTFFPEDPRIISNSAAQISSRDGDTLRLSLERDPRRRDPIPRIRGVLFSDQGWSESGMPKAVQIDTNPGEPITEGVTSSSQSQEETHVGFVGFGAALLFAWLGGILLNLMPCVFPVLSIKVLSFVTQADQSPHITRRHGLVFTAGVIVSFWVLALIVLSVKAGGEQLGWGFQLQSPTFVVGMIFTLLCIGCVFLTDVTIGQRLQTLAGASKLPTNLIGSFCNGALATAVATPCTAPFMSSALAATIVLPPIAGFAVFTCLGLGMSTPYLILAYNPRLLRFLPKPGEWMITFKELMAFPLFASVVWLSRVFARQMGIEPPALNLVMDVLWGIFIAAFGFWLLTVSRRSAAGRMNRALNVLAILGIILGVYIAIPSTAEVDDSRARACAPSDTVAPFTDGHGLLWENYSEDRLMKLTAQGRPVYIDFTAEWCITCQVNERVVFSSQEVRDLIAEKNVTLVRADWTSKNQVITNALRRYGRNGVPLNVIITGPTSEPIVLPNILTPGIVIEALKKLPG
jgi:thiol:disulfide interchange protein